MNIARNNGRSKCSARIVVWDWQRRNVPPPTAARSVGADAFIGPLGCDSHRTRGAAPNPVGADCISARAQGAIPAAPKGPLV